jgi:hypothetical protein
MPHRSNTTPHQIHTRTESYCQTGIVESNYLRSVSYRSRWYGWEERGSASAGPVPRQWIRVTVAVDCARGGKAPVADGRPRHRRDQRPHLHCGGVRGDAV